MNPFQNFKKEIKLFLVAAAVSAVLVAAGILLLQVGLGPSSPTPTPVAQTPPPTPLPQPQAVIRQELPFQKISLESDLVLRESFENYPASRGLFQTEAEFQTIWGFVENWRTGLSVNIPDIDFTRYNVLWYATERNASFVEVEKIEEFSDFVEARVIIVQSDFLTRALFLWMIPKITKELRFVERTEFNPGSRLDTLLPQVRFVNTPEFIFHRSK